MPLISSDPVEFAVIIGYILIATFEWLVRSLLRRRFTMNSHRYDWRSADRPGALRR